MENYRDEALNIVDYPIEDCKELVSLFNNKFPNKDAFMKLEDNVLHIMLSQVDMIKYREFLDSTHLNETLLQASLM